MRRGTSLLELVVALALGTFVCAAVAGILQVQLRFSRATAESVQDAEAVRTVGHVLGGELPWLDPATDIRALGADSLAGRWFRGGGIVCAAEAGAAVVAYHGMREPDPAKDSVLAEAAAGESAQALAGAAPAPGACPVSLADPTHPTDSAVAQRWSLAAPPPPGTVVLVFESGTYLLASGALRYRRALGGRQPLTAERLDTRDAGFDSVPGGVRVRLRLPAAGGVPRMPPPDLYIPFLNAPPPDTPAAPGIPAGGGGR